MDGTQVAAEHPYRGVEPLEGGENVNEQHVPGVPESYVSPFMRENGSVAGFIVAAVHHDIVHPAEWCQPCETGHADGGPIVLGMLFASAYKTDDSEYRPKSVTERRHHSYNKHSGQDNLPPRSMLFADYTDLSDIRWSQCANIEQFTVHQLRLMHRDDAQRQHKGGNSRHEQHDAVHAVERLAGKHQAVEHIEHHNEHCHLKVVDQEINHSLLSA